MPPGLLSRLIVAFVLSVSCFVGSTLYSESISRQVDRAALSIANNAMPSIRYLAQTRGDLRRLNVSVWRRLTLRSAATAAAVQEARAAVDAAFEDYLSLPSAYAEMHGRRVELHRALTSVDRAVNEALAAPAPQAERAGLQVTVAIDRAAEVIRSAIEINAAEGERLARTVETGHRRATHIALLLDLLSTLFTGLAAYFTVRALSHHARVLDERNRLAARRAEELEQFAGRVAHDVLGPLSATRLAIGHAAAQVHDGTVHRSLERGQRGVERVASIVDGLLRFARAGARPEPGVVTPVAPVVQSIVTELEPVAQAAQVSLSRSPMPDCSVYTNAGVLASLVENLTRNAIKYMGNRSVRQVEIKVTANRAWVRLEVCDTGPGIPPSIRETVFDPHVRGRGSGQPGIGLGLATVKRIVEAHGGRVGLSSRQDEGSTFYCELPRADTADPDRAVTATVDSRSA